MNHNESIDSSHNLNSFTSLSSTPCFHNIRLIGPSDNPPPSSQVPTNHQQGAKNPHNLNSHSSLSITPAFDNIKLFSQPRESRFSPQEDARPLYGDLRNAQASQELYYASVGQPSADHEEPPKYKKRLLNNDNAARRNTLPTSDMDQKASIMILEDEKDNTDRAMKVIQEQSARSAFMKNEDGHADQNDKANQVYSFYEELERLNSRSRQTEEHPIDSSEYILPKKLEQRHSTQLNEFMYNSVTIEVNATGIQPLHPNEDCQRDHVEKIAQGMLQGYELLGIKEGGQGIVCKLRRTNGEHLVLKVFKNGIRPFIREANMLKAVYRGRYQFINKDGVYGIIFDAAMGDLNDFRRYLADSNRKLTANEFLYLSSQVVSQVSDLILKGYCHRDIKPHNIVLEFGTLRPLLIDYDLAISLSAIPSSLTWAGTRCYSSSYMLSKRSGYDEIDLTLSDYHSAAVSLIEIASGKVWETTEECIKFIADNYPDLEEGFTTLLKPDQRIFVPAEQLSTHEEFIRMIQKFCDNGYTDERTLNTVAYVATVKRCFSIESIIEKQCEALLSIFAKSSKNSKEGYKALEGRHENEYCLSNALPTDTEMPSIILEWHQKIIYSVMETLFHQYKWPEVRGPLDYISMLEMSKKDLEVWAFIKWAINKEQLQSNYADFVKNNTFKADFCLLNHIQGFGHSQRILSKAEKYNEYPLLNELINSICREEQVYDRWLRFEDEETESHSNKILIQLKEDFPQYDGQSKLMLPYSKMKISFKYDPMMYSNEFDEAFGNFQCFNETITTNNRMVKEYISTGNCLFVNTKALEKYITIIDGFALNYPLKLININDWDFWSSHVRNFNIVELHHQDRKMLMYSLGHTIRTYNIQCYHIVRSLVLDCYFFKALWLHSALLKQPRSSSIFGRLSTLLIKCGDIGISYRLKLLFDLCAFVSTSSLLEQTNDENSPLYGLQQLFMQFSRDKDALRGYLLDSIEVSEPVMLLLKQLTPLMSALVYIIELKHVNKKTLVELDEDGGKTPTQESNHELEQKLKYFFDVFTSSQNLHFKFTFSPDSKHPPDSQAFLRKSFFSSLLTDLILFQKATQDFSMNLTYHATATKTGSGVRIESLKIVEAIVCIGDQSTSIAFLKNPHFVSLQSLSKLSLLFEIRNTLSSEQCIQLESVLSELKLQSLRLSFNPNFIQTDQQVKQIANGISCQTSLLHLDLAIKTSPITNRALVFITDAITNLKPIKSINIFLTECSEITNEGVRNMIHTICKTTKCSKIKLTLLRCFQITEEVKQYQSTNSVDTSIMISWRSAFVTSIDVR